MNTFTKVWYLAIAEVLLLVCLFFVVSGVAPPAVNEAHYFAKSKNYWDPSWCAGDIFASSGNPHLLFHYTFGALTQWFSLETTAWIGRILGWTLIAIGLRAVTAAVTNRPLASLWVAVIWIAGVYGFNLAGEWVIGGIEGKVPAYGLMLLALRMMIDGKWRMVWPLLGLASAFHVLVGGWSVVIALGVFAGDKRSASSWKSQLVPLCLGGCIGLIGIYPALALTRGVPAEAVTAAARIYSYGRLTHHLLPSALEPAWYVRHTGLIMITAVLLWRLRSDTQLDAIRRFAVGAVLIAVAGLILGTLPAVAPDLAAKLLRYYWFRMTDAVVPLALALALVRLPEAVPESAAEKSLRRLAMLIAVVIAGFASYESTQMTVRTRSGRVASAIGMNTVPQNREQVVSDWIEVCEWVDRTLPRDEVLLTPRNQQTFKWYANRAEVVNWKDVPQDAERLVEWSRRFRDVFPQRLGTVRVSIRYPELIRFRQQYGARFMIVDRRYSTGSLPLVQVYPQSPYETNATYGVYRLP
ncbi:MAG: DUF6798 domain-containing protein [Planctomycetaceae bacterium]